MDRNSGKELVENKLILLYSLSKIDSPISNQQLNKFVLDNKLMNYFSLQEYLNELTKDELILNTEFEGKNCYIINEKGRKMLEYFLGHIPQYAKNQVDTNIPTIRKLAKNDLFITSNLIQEADDDFVVECKIKEHSFELLSLKLHVGNKFNANDICVNWKKNAESIYNDIIDVLTKKRSNPH